jgi:hypothetical protein
MADSQVISLAAVRSQRRPEVRIFCCVECRSYSFKIVELDGEDWLACANCENWIQEFKLIRTRDDI